jgi:hypothetical protein
MRTKIRRAIAVTVEFIFALTDDGNQVEDSNLYAGPRKIVEIGEVEAAR